MIGLSLALAGALQAAEQDRAREVGQKLLETLPTLTDQPIIRHFEVQFDSKAVGVGELILTPKSANGIRVLEYRHAIAIKMPGGITMAAVVESVLSEKFAPLRIVAYRRISGAEGEHNARQSAEIEGGKYVIHLEEDGKKSRREMEIPEVPIVHGLDALVERIGTKNREYFILRQLDLEAGKVVEIHFRWDTTEDRKTLLHASPDGVTADEYFVFDKETLAAYGKANPPFVEKRVTEAQYEEVKKLLGID